MIEKLSGRAGSAAGAAVCAALLGFGFYLQYARGLEPCPLCLVQRGFFMAVMAVCLVAPVHRPRPLRAAVYRGLAGVVALGGAAVAGRPGLLPHLAPPHEAPIR